MTRIILILNPELQSTHISEDPRPPRQVMAAINSRKLVVGQPEVNMHGARQWALLAGSLEVVTVVVQPPPVKLSLRLFDVLFCLADGKSRRDTADQLGITIRMTYVYVHTLKTRFDIWDLGKLLDRAAEYGFIEQ